MQLERLAMTVRPGNGWEALDLGIALGRRFWQPAMKVWLAVYLPAAIAAGLVNWLWDSNFLWATLVLWWLKPAFDRFVLHVFSRAIFGEVPTVRATLAQWRTLLAPGLIRQLTWARLGPGRAFYAPVHQLERQSGERATRRMRVLGRNGAGTAAWHWIVCAHFETIVLFSLGALALLFVPGNAHQGSGGFLDGLFGDDEEIGWALTLADLVYYVVAVSVIELFYVAGGFALYLQRRAQLEGWDIELGLRRIETRLANRAGVLRAVLCAFAAGTVLATTSPAPALARDAAPSPEQVQRGGSPSPEAPHSPATTARTRDAVKEVLADPIFGEDKVEKVWRPKDRDKKKREPDPDMAGWREWIERVAGALRVLAWIAAAAIVIALAWWARRVLVVRKPDRINPQYRPPVVLFGQEVHPDSLPRDIPGAAIAYVQSGGLREALSLLYRGALSTLIHRDSVELAAGDTEEDVLAASRGVLAPGTIGYLDELIGGWREAAYAARPPAPEDVLGWAAHWRLHFGGERIGPDAPPAPAASGGAA